MKHFNKAVWSGKKVFLNKVKTLLEKHILLTFSCQSWKSTKIVRLEKTETFCLCQTRRYNTNHYDTRKEKEKTPVLSRTDFWMVSEFHGIPCFLFLFRTNGKKNTCMKTTSVTVMFTAMFKVLSRQLRGMLTQAFWKTPYSLWFYGYRLTYVLVL